MAKEVDVPGLKALLKSYVQSGNLNFIVGSGASVPAIPLAGDIENEVDKLRDENKENEANKITYEFLKNLNEKHRLLFENSVDSNVKTTLGWYCDFVKIVDELLFERKNHLLPRQANVFTTNYDLFIETACSKVPSVILNDGFDRSLPMSDNFKYSPEIFHDRTFRSGNVYSLQSEVPSINLFKLHGSLNWIMDGELREVVMTKEFRGPLTEDQLYDEKEIERYFKRYVLVLPNVMKHMKTSMDRVYYDLLRQFANAIEKENSVLISFGFSFADQHIADIVRRSLRNPTSQLIIITYKKDEVSRLSKIFETEKNVIILSPNEDENFDFPRFTDLLGSVIRDEEK